MRLLPTLAGAAVIASSMIAAPAQAKVAPDCGNWSWDVPVPTAQSLCYPMQPGTTIVIEGPKYMWGLRQTAATIDAKLTGITVKSDIGIKCASYPGTYCLKVQKVDIPVEGRAGEFDTPDQRYVTGAMAGVISLDPHWSFEALCYRKSIATHEFGHALGMIHHTGTGLVTNNVDNTYASYMFNTAEWAALKGWYNS